MPPDDSGLTSTAHTPSRDATTEHTPLLPERAQQDAPTAPPDDQEPSTKELILVLGSVWVGVFLAALGIGALSYLLRTLLIN